MGHLRYPRRSFHLLAAHLRYFLLPLQVKIEIRVHTKYITMQYIDRHYQSPERAEPAPHSGVTGASCSMTEAHECAPQNRSQCRYDELKRACFELVKLELPTSQTLGR